MVVVQTADDDEWFAYNDDHDDLYIIDDPNLWTHRHIFTDFIRFGTFTLNLLENFDKRGQICHKKFIYKSLGPPATFLQSPM